jgi:outer membrane protein assembly factor BamC
MLLQIRAFFSKLLASASITKRYQLILKEDINSQTRLIFVDLSEENDDKTISYSAELFDQIASKF